MLGLGIKKGQAKEVVKQDDTPKKVEGYPKHRTCLYCNKEYASAETHMIETTAGNINSNYRTYDVSGVTMIHTDGTKCSAEYLEYRKLDSPIVHRNLSMGVKTRAWANGLSASNKGY
jgi:hypothetical protein